MRASYARRLLGSSCELFRNRRPSLCRWGLKAEGIETEVIEDSHVPALPIAKTIRRLDCPPEALMIADPYGRKFPVAWGHVMLLAAGTVQQATFDRKRTEREEVTIKMHGLIPVQQRTIKVDYTSREGAAKLMRAEIILSGGVAQYSIEAESFNYECLGDRVSHDKMSNFCLLLREIVKFAPQAALNRGAAALLAEPPGLVVYPHKNNLQDEIQWFLWQKTVVPSLRFKVQD